MTLPTSSSSTTTNTSNPSTETTRNRRAFALNGVRFRLHRSRPTMDDLLDGLNWVMEGVVYLVGPLLIMLALAIMGLLSYVFFTMLLPMYQLKYAQSPFQHLYLGLHVVWVLFLLVNVLFNYALCVMTRHKGPAYDQAVRELAEATNVSFPETANQLEGYRREYQDRMVVRMRRRRERFVQSEAGNGVAHQRRGQSTTTQPSTAAPATQTTLRSWMLNGPFEWGFCANSRQPKPPRSHYDHVSKTLVLNLDHYCPWMFNAIGYFNYRYFVNFLIYIFVGMLYGTIITLEPYLMLNSKEYRDFAREEYKAQKELPRPHPMIPHRSERTLLTLAFMICLAVGSAILLLGGFHVYLTLTGQTTIEFHGNWSNRQRAKQEGTKWQNPYDQGWKKNWQQVYGSQFWVWALQPSTRQPEFLPVPVPGVNCRRGDSMLKTNSIQPSEELEV